jgi:alanine-alpha-ketoisovalerate/valine-pyruvate aminotransferase
MMNCKLCGRDMSWLNFKDLPGVTEKNYENLKPRQTVAVPRFEPGMSQI